MCFRRRCSKKKDDYSSSPYPVEDFSAPWPIQGITPIPRATTNWDTAPSMEMTEGGSTHTLVDKKTHTNGVVSYHRYYSGHWLNYHSPSSL